MVGGSDCLATLLPRTSVTPARQATRTALLHTGAPRPGSSTRNAAPTSATVRLPPRVRADREDTTVRLRYLHSKCTCQAGWMRDQHSGARSSAGHRACSLHSKRAASCSSHEHYCTPALVQPEKAASQSTAACPASPPRGCPPGPPRRCPLPAHSTAGVARQLQAE